MVETQQKRADTIHSKVSFVDLQNTREYFKMVRTLTIIVLDNTISK